MKHFIALFLSLLFSTSVFADSFSYPVTYPFVLAGVLKGANFNSTADQPIILTTSSANFRIQSIIVTNPSMSMSTAVGGFYITTAKGGTPIVATSQVYSALATNAANTAGNMLVLATPASTQYNTSTVYFSLTTAQGAAATADIYVYIQPLPQDLVMTEIIKKKLKPRGKMFQPGSAGGPGRTKGSRNKLSEKFLAALFEDFEESGVWAIKACRLEDPTAYCKMIASLLPKQVDVKQTNDISDTELERQLLQYFARDIGEVIEGRAIRAIGIDEGTRAA